MGVSGVVNFAWTEERVQRLKTLAADKLSASKIAAAIGGGLTRNAVIGKMHRLGIASGKKVTVPSQPRPRKEPRVHIRVPRRSKSDREGLNAQQRQDQAAALRALFATETGPASGGVRFVDLRPSHCRWPLGDPSDLETFRFCGEPKEGEGPYCACHRQIARPAWVREAAE